MIVLAIDTAGADCSAALVDVSGSETRVIAVRRDTLGRGHAEHLMPMLQAMLAETGRSIADVDRFGVTVGPGSFTGLRVGVSAARGFALATGRPAIGVGTLEALAEPHLATGGTPAASPDWTALAAALDARHGNVYIQVFASNGTSIGPPSAVPAADAMQVAAFDAVTGSGATLIRDRQPEVPARSLRVLGTDGCPDPVMVARLAARQQPGDATPTPLYVRPPDAAPAGPPLPRSAGN